MPNVYTSDFVRVSTTPWSYEPLRTPTVFKTVKLTATGNVWTPASGKRFRILHVFWQVTGEATLAAAGDLDVQFQDGAGNNIGIAFTTYVPANPVTSAFGDVTDQIDLHGNGYLSTTANNILVANLSAALTAGAVRINVEGTEE